MNPKVFLSLAFFCLSCLPLPAQCLNSDVAILAGMPGSSGNLNGMGQGAAFNGPDGVAVDRHGNVYVADTQNHLIRKITPAGLVTTLAGSGSAGSANGTGIAASFNSPASLAVDREGVVFVADTGNNLIRRINPDGVVTTLAGSGSAGSANGMGSAASFNAPRGIALDRAGNLYVAERENHRIRQITPPGLVTTLAGSTAGLVNGPAASARFNRPFGITTDGAGNIYVADTGNHVVRRIDRNGMVTTLAGSGRAGSANGTGVLASFNNLEGLTVDGSGNVYVADTLNHAIRRITPNGVVSTFAGAIGVAGFADGAANRARFDRPVDVISDSSGNLYVADLRNQLVRKIGNCALTPYELLFAHFGEGGGVLTSEIILFTLKPEGTAQVRVLIRDNDGNPLSVDLNGGQVDGELELEIPSCGIRVLATDGLGSIREGSVRVLSDQPLGGVVLFGGTVGVAGVGDSPEFGEGFIAPVQSSAESMTRPGVALMNLEPSPLTVTLTLFDADGGQLSSQTMDIAGRGHRARFVDEVFEELDFSNFVGLLKVTAPGRISATVLQTQPGEFVTLPVAAPQDSPPPAGDSLDEKLYFSHFGKGGGLLASEITVLNLDPDQPARVALSVRDDQGALLPVSLNGEANDGEVELNIPACGIRVLRTDSAGDVEGGSVRVCSDLPLAGVIAFGGAVGFAGVGSSEPFSNGFVAPMQSSRADDILPGIAISNLEDSAVRATLQLFDQDGRLLETEEISLDPRGHIARFLNQLYEGRDVTNFLGLLKVTANGRIAATVLQTRPGQLATLPVTAIPVQ